MSAPSRAVFLSYASQDAEAVARLCEALRATGVEVWFDQNELVGGDVWDAKIRKQIAECALFVPVISASTQARTEGYFRLEWKLAAQRTHMMSDDKAFLLPVLIDGTRDTEAKVPAEFKAVQWTRIGSADSLNAFCARVKKLLGAPEVEAGRLRPAMRGEGTPPPGNRSRSWLIPALVALVTLVALTLWRPWPTSPAPTNPTPVASAPSPAAQPPRDFAPAKSLAVLAFANLSDDKTNEFFSDGISEELLNVLAKVPGLKVSARTSAFSFKGKDTPVPEIARTLGVAYVVEGSVRRAGDKVRITAQLVKASDGFRVWSDTFTRDLKDVFAVQDEIAGLIAQNLRLKMGASPPGAKSAINPEAFELYVQARQAWNLRTAEGFDRAEELLNRALQLEPDFARAHAALSDVWGTRGLTMDQTGQFGQRESPLTRRIIATAERAVALDPNSAEAQASLGNAYASSWRLDEGTRRLRHAVALNPNYASAHQFLGRTLLTQGYFAEAAAELARAVELDPLSHRIIDNYAIALFAMGRPTEALAAAERALALRPDSVQAAIWRARSLSSLGRHEEAVAQARRLKDAGDPQSVYLVEVFVAAGLKSEAEAMLAKPDRNFGGRKFTGLLELGRRDEALAAMNPAEMNPQSLFQSNLETVRDDPRFKQVLATLGLTEADARIQAWHKAHPPEKPAAKK